MKGKLPGLHVGLLTCLILALLVTGAFRQVFGHGFRNRDDDKCRMLATSLFGKGSAESHAADFLLHVANTLILFALLRYGMENRNLHNSDLPGFRIGAVNRDSDFD